MHVSLNIIPSGYIPYPNLNGEKIKLRRLTYEEVIEFSENRDRSSDLIDYIKKRDIVTGVDIDEITMGDWSFIELSMVILSYSNPSYTFSLGECPKCKVKYSELEEDELFLNIGDIKVSKIPKLWKKVTHGQISFEELPPEVQSTAIVDLDGTKVEVDFFRIKHHLQLLKEKKEDNIVDQIKSVSKVDFKTIDNVGFALLKAAFDKMKHGLDSSFTVTCPDCKYSKSFRMDWGLLQFTPHYIDAGFIEERISFDKVGKPAEHTPDELPPRSSISRKLG